MLNVYHSSRFRVAERVGQLFQRAWLADVVPDGSALSCCVRVSGSQTEADLRIDTRSQKAPTQRLLAVPNRHIASSRIETVNTALLGEFVALRHRLGHLYTVADGLDGGFETAVNRALLYRSASEGAVSTHS